MRTGTCGGVFDKPLVFGSSVELDQDSPFPVPVELDRKILAVDGDVVTISTLTPLGRVNRGRPIGLRGLNLAVDRRREAGRRRPDRHHSSTSRFHLGARPRTLGQMRSAGVGEWWRSGPVQVDARRRPDARVQVAAMIPLPRLVSIQVFGM
jgi:hypothetical protein